ncbi:DUF222 domain-containing protein [Rhodococcus sp. IEGM 1379]|uniref:DUF222 domain-containing protein n=1 Tax=Rhodococcus sp. IEGM 1379 TaxID=3047086 RepID=UPI0024B7E106|nr:DUF222 domain-containing protein [Rhodococcus sp. IEGM 1379]MDI9916664.1 DUF222 domain-containing protein [Rhodococcus sp. IEGM 1379]
MKSEVFDLARARHDMQSRLVHLVVEMFTRDALPDTGFRAIAQWLHRSTNLEIGECSQLVSLARLFMLEPAVAQSFHDGDIDALKARQVAQFCQHPPKNMHIADIEKAREILLDLASKKVSDCDGSPGSNPAHRKEVRQPRRRHPRRRGFFSATSSTLPKVLYGRVSVKGDFDAVNGARLIALLSGLSKPNPEVGGVKDLRTPALRRADGFCELLRRFEMAGLGPVEGGVKPHLTITATAKDLTDLQALKDLLPSTEETRLRDHQLGRSHQSRQCPDAGLRLRGHPNTARPERCSAQSWPRRANRHDPAAADLGRQRWRMCVSGVRHPAGMVRRAPHNPLDRQWSNGFRQSHTFVRSPSSVVAPY